MMVRNKRLLRSIAAFFIVLFLSNTLAATVSYALSTSPNQIEYMEYEPSYSTDMVNLLTGDFTYNIPLLHIPSPEGGFTMNVAYHSGVALEKEASWVGLGWSLNPGAINRNIVQFPDDAKGQTASINSNVAGGDGFIKSYLLYNRYYDSNKGFGGGVSLFGIAGVDWFNGQGVTNFNVIGVSVNTQSGAVDASVSSVAYGVVNTTHAIVGFADPANFASAGASTAAISALSTASSLAQLGISSYNLAQGTGSSFTDNYGHWTSSITKTKFLRWDYEYYLDDTFNEFMYGSLYLGGAYDAASCTSGPCGPDPTDNVGNRLPHFYKSLDNKVSSDVFMRSSGTHAYVINPVNMAIDNYSVMGQGISGAIRPHNLETGSVALPRLLSKYHYSYNIVPFTDSDLLKTQFRYFGNTNKYDHHNGLDPNENTDYSRFGFYSSTTNIGFSDRNSIGYEITDESLSIPDKRRESNRYGKQNDRLIDGKNIYWYTNKEIYDGQAVGLMDDLGTNFRYNLPEDGIGGFAVTSEEGLTYHYSLPVYGYDEYSHSAKTSAEYSMSTPDRFAVNWLLTSITGSDFVDRNNNGAVDHADWGYWVKFDYGRTAVNSFWKAPFTGKDLSKNGLASYSIGKTEKYYLNEIITRTHRALFIKDVRKDGRTYYTAQDIFTPTSISNLPVYPQSSLLLKEVVLLNEKDYQLLINGSLPETVGFSYDEVTPLSAGLSPVENLQEALDVYDVTSNSSYRQFLNNNAIRRIVFNYDYSLCDNARNSFDSGANAPIGNEFNIEDILHGKLTMNSIQFFGLNSIEQPGYDFQYANNEPYERFKYDAWGMYNSSGTISYEDHRVSNVSSDGTQWNLDKIITPLGSELDIIYERDDFRSIAGEPILDMAEFDILDLGGGAYQGDLVSSQNLFDINAKDGQVGYIYVSGVEFEITIDAQSTTQFRFSAPSSLALLGSKGVLKYSFDELKGGDVRVKTLTVSDNTNAYSTKYLYKIDGILGVQSSGVVGKTPAQLGLYEYDFYKLYDFPSTPVLYSDVITLNNYNEATNTYLTSSHYSFYVPNVNVVSRVTTTITNEEISDPSVPDIQEDRLWLKNYLESILISTAQIGKIKNIIVLDVKGETLNQTKFNYTSNLPEGQGVNTEGSILCEVVDVLDPSDNDSDEFYSKLIRTTKKYTPFELVSVESENEGVSSIIQNSGWDFLTGRVLKRKYENELGVKYITVTEPAYHMYDGMGPIGVASSNKNMLLQETASYTFKDEFEVETYAVNISQPIYLNSNEYLIEISNGTLHPFYGQDYGPWAVFSNDIYSKKIIQVNPDRKSFVVQSSNDIVGSNITFTAYERPIISVSVLTWEDNWDYHYNEDEDAVYKTEQSVPTWRKKASYTWNGSRQGDGTLLNVSSFDWTDAVVQTPNWEFISEITAYDPYSHSLESRDVAVLYSASKMDEDSRHYVASAWGTNRESFFHTSFEHGRNGYYDGEIKSISGTISSNYAHTGKYSMSVDGSNGVQYIARTVDGLETGLNYRAGVWVNTGGTSAVPEMRVDMIGNGYNESFAMNSIPIISNGEWFYYVVDFAVPEDFETQLLPDGLFVNLSSSGGICYFDDFRLQPIDAIVSGTVYDQKTGNVTYILDNHNLYTRYEYDEAGRVRSVYKETSQYGTAGEVKVSEYNYNFAR